VRVLLASKALVVGAYQRKLEEIARQPEVELIAAVPPSWRDPSYETKLERRHLEGYELVETPISVNGNFHLFFFPELPALLDRFRPDLLHFDEEPYNLSTFLAVWNARRRNIPTITFTWQNLVRHYPLPFRMIERYVYRNTAWALVGTETAGAVLRQKGYRGPISVIPQFGVDPEIFKPAEDSEQTRPFTVGFVGRLMPEKGVDLLIQAVAQLPQVRLVIAGDGPQRPSLQALVTSLGLEERTKLLGAVPSGDVPAVLRQIDVLVLPSRSLPNWTEQFGRILVEAMCSGVPVVGSSCGEIPQVIGDAGLVFPEDDLDALVRTLKSLREDAALRARLGAQGRQRALTHFTHEQIARDTVEVYRKVLGTER
jgi:glycosyltransferase involved in cell wall biosynthesis